MRQTSARRAAKPARLLGKKARTCWLNRIGIESAFSVPPARAGTDSQDQSDETAHQRTAAGAALTRFGLAGDDGMRAGRSGARSGVQLTSSRTDQAVARREHGAGAGRRRRGRAPVPLRTERGRHAERFARRAGKRRAAAAAGSASEIDAGWQGCRRVTPNSKGASERPGQPGLSFLRRHLLNWKSASIGSAYRHNP